MSGDIHPFPLYAFMAWRETIYFFYFDLPCTGNEKVATVFAVVSRTFNFI
jgi:hypothetical protein